MTPGEGTAIGDAVALSLRVGQPQGVRGAAAAARDRASSPTAPATAARSRPTTPRSRRNGRACRSTPCSSARRTASSTEKLTGGYRRIIRVPPDPETLQQVAQASGGEFFAAPDAEGLRRVYDELGSRLGTRKEDREITDVFAAAATILLLTGASLSAFLFKRVP